MKPAVVILVQRPAMEAEAREFAAALDADGRFAPRLILEGSARRRAADPDTAEASARPRPAWKSAGLAGLRWAESVPAADFAKMAALMARAKRSFASWASKDVAALVLFDDRAPISNLYLIRLAQDAGIGVLILPYAHTAPENDAMLRKGLRSTAIGQGPLSAPRRWLARAYPSQVYVSDEGPMFFYGFGGVLLLAAMGLADSRPWVLGGGGPDLVGLSGPDETEARVAMGVPRERIRVIGQPTLDRLAQARALQGPARAQRLPEPLRDDSRPLVIVAVPQYAEHGMLPWPEHWTVTEDLLAAAVGDGARVLLSLHPKSKPSDYEALAARHGAAISSRPLADVLPLADVFVATYSSTVFWAIRLGVPTVIADLPRQNLSTFADFRDIPVETTRDGLAAAIGRLVRSPEIRAVTGERLLAAGSRLGLIDGRACARAIDAVAELVTRKEDRHVA